MATSVTRFAITWTWAENLTVGTYLNGDPYVVAPSGLNITAITGATNALAVVVQSVTIDIGGVPTTVNRARVKNGSWYDPSGTTSSSQGIDSWYKGDEIYPSGYYNPALNAARPVRASGSNLVINGANAAIVTSATHTFDAADVGCAIRISGGTGFEVSIYRVASVAGGAATLDRACGTVGSTGGQWIIDSEIGPSNTLFVDADTSLVSFLSYSGLREPIVTDASVLTVVSVAPAANSFRPGYCNPDKSSPFTLADIDYSVLPGLAPVTTPPSKATSEARFERTWIEIITNIDGRSSHPSNNQPDYGREIGSYTGEALLQLCLNYSEAELETLMIRMLQRGLDIYGSAVSGGAWTNNGGHQQGRKAPLVLAALAFNDAGMLAWADKAQHNIFAEDQQTFVVDAAQLLVVPENTSQFPRASYATKSSTVTITQATPALVNWTSHGLLKAQWVQFTTTGTLPAPLNTSTLYYVSGTGLTSNSFQIKATYDGASVNTTTAGSGVHTATFYSLGLPEWGEKHSTQKTRDGSNFDAKYRDVVGENQIGTILAGKLFVGGRTAWNWEPVFDYFDRLFSIYSAGHFNSFVYNLYLAYGGGDAPVSVPSAPSLVVATALGPSQVQIVWQDNADNETYQTVERANSSGGTYTLVENGTVAADIEAFIDTTALPSRTYWYRVRAWNIVGPSLASNNDDATTPAAAPTNNVFGWYNAAPGNST